VRTLIIFIGCALALSLYFLGSTVLSIIRRYHAEQNIKEIEGGLAVKEQTYVNLVRMITPELAKSKGFVEIGNPQYVVASPAQKSFTLREER